MSELIIGRLRRWIRDRGSEPFDTLLDVCRRAADHFLPDTLPLGDAEQSPDDYVQQLSATTGMPNVLVRRNMQKVYGVLAQVDGLHDAGMAHGDISGSSILIGSTEEHAGFEKQNTAAAVSELIDFAVHLVPALARARFEPQHTRQMLRGLRGQDQFRALRQGIGNVDAGQAHASSMPSPAMRASSSISSGVMT